MFRKRRSTKSGADGGNSDPSPCKWIRSLPWGHPLTTRNLLAKKQRVVDSGKILLDIAKESADWFPPLKSALGGVNALIKHYEVWAGLVVVTHN